MKRTLVLISAIIIICSCKKETSYQSKPSNQMSLNTQIVIKPVVQSNLLSDLVINGMEQFTFNNTNVIMSSTLWKPNFYYLKYSLFGKDLTLLFNRKVSGNLSNCTLSDTTGKTVYLNFTVNDVTGTLTNITDPYTIPYEKILPPSTPASWAKCMGATIRECAATPICGQGMCKGEAIVGCVAGWSVACLFKYYVPTLPKFPPIIHP